MKPLLFWVLLLAPGVLCAQGFHVSGICSQPMRGRAQLTIYDGDSTSRLLRSDSKGAEFSFSGTVQHPVLAELRYNTLPQSLFFFLENSEINIALNVQNPASSPVQGSRSNSQYRFALENCQSGQRSDCLKQWIVQNSSSIFAPFILSELWETDYEEVRSLFEQLQGDACHTYHYHQLRQSLKSLLAVSEGQKMPDILLPDTNGILFHLDSVQSDTTFSLLLIGASWCEQCRRIEAQLQARNNEGRVFPIVVHIDNDKQGWDAPFLQQLSVDRIPYLILLDKEGIILARDLRIWELERFMKSTIQN